MSQSKKEKFYTYLWLREDGTPYYVGKGCADRAYRRRPRCRNTNPPNDKARIIIQYYPDEPSAFIAERFLISFYGRLDAGTGCLHNFSDGGEGLSGYNYPEEVRKKIGDRQRGRKRSEETIEKIRLTLTGLKKSPEHIANMVAARYGKEYVPRIRRTRSEAMKLKWQDREYRALMISKLKAHPRPKGYKLSATTRANISKAKTLWHAQQREQRSSNQLKIAFAQ